MTESRDPTLDVLLDLDGQVLVVDPKGGDWVRFVVMRVPVSPAKPGHERRIRPYEYRDAATLLADFWATVDAALREVAARQSV